MEKRLGNKCYCKWIQRKHKELTGTLLVSHSLDGFVSEKITNFQNVCVWRRKPTEWNTVGRVAYSSKQPYFFSERPGRTWQWEATTKSSGNDQSSGRRGPRQKKTAGFVKNAGGHVRRHGLCEWEERKRFERRQPEYGIEKKIKYREIFHSSACYCCLDFSNARNWCKVLVGKSSLK